MLPSTTSTLIRTSSASSISSEDSVLHSTIDSPSSLVLNNPPHKRTRKRFNPKQIALLESVYQTCSHPTRDQREVIGRKVDLELRSVTVWFQNRRQAERRAAVLEGESEVEAPASSSSILSTTIAATLGYHGVNAGGSKIPPRPRPTHSVQRRPQPYPPTLSRRPSLDVIATRAERRETLRPSPRLRTHSLPPSLHPPPHTPAKKLKAIHERMPSSLRGQESTRPDTRGGATLRRKRTLEWACEHAHRRHVRRGGCARVDNEPGLLNPDHLVSVSESLPQQPEQDRHGKQSGEPVPGTVLDIGGDTEDDTEPDEALTPSITPLDDFVYLRGDAHSRESSILRLEPYACGDDKPLLQNNCEGQIDETRDEETMKAAYTLCGLGGGGQ